MKMRKLLASGVAASLAVTSMATVASAAEKTFPMGHTIGTIELKSSSGVELGEKYLLTDDEFQNDIKSLGISSDDWFVLAPNGADCDTITGISLKVTGVKGTRGAASKTYTYNFKKFSSYDFLKKGEVIQGTVDGVWVDYTVAKGEKVWDADKNAWVAGDDGAYILKGDSGAVWALPIYAETAPLDGFLPEQFLEITKMELESTATVTTESKDVYADWGVNTWGSWNAATYKILQAIDANNAKSPVYEAVGLASSAWGYNYADAKSTKVVYPLLKLTGTDTLGRMEIDQLSVSNAWGSDGYDGEYDDSNQSYEGEDTTAGEVKVGFSGLASQIADFFNKQTNGTITFTFTAEGAASGGVEWENGGIPSTQTGIKNVMGAMSENDIALFINYKQTGSLQAVTSLDKAAGSVTFDISDILDSLGGQTMGVIDNVYYGLNKGIAYDDGTGLYVEKITMAYEEDTAEDIEDEETEEVEDEDDADDAEEEEEEEEAEIDDEDDADDAEEEEEEDDDDVQGDVVTTPSTEDDDANPATGVALAVVPALVAAAAAVVSKKRK